MNDDRSQTTRLLKAVHAGDQAAAERLLPLVYAELHRVANAYMRRERPDHTLQPTALINEAYLRLIQEDVDWNSREHFIGFAAHVMRRVLVDYARASQARKRGGDRAVVDLETVQLAAETRSIEILELDRALGELEEVSPRQARIVELRCFAGLNVPEAAAALGLNPRTVDRDWAAARVWLRRRLRP